MSCFARSPGSLAEPVGLFRPARCVLCGSQANAEATRALTSASMVASRGCLAVANRILRHGAARKSARAGGESGVPEPLGANGGNSCEEGLGQRGVGAAFAAPTPGSALPAFRLPYEFSGPDGLGGVGPSSRGMPGSLSAELSMGKGRADGGAPLGP